MNTSDQPSLETILSRAIDAHQTGDFESAIQGYRTVVAHQPQQVAAWYGLGVLLFHTGSFEESREAFKQTVKRKPDYADAWNRLGNAHLELSEIQQAVECYSRAIALSPNNPHARCNRALAYLISGDDQQGWREYEHRWSLPNHRQPDFPQPRWKGEPLSGRTVLLDWEQGLGDSLQFVRFAKIVQQQGGTVILRCQPPLATLLRKTPGIEQLVADGEPLPDFDVYAPLMSLPFLLNLKTDSLPKCVPYVFAESELVKHWSPQIATENGFRIGICWRGNPGHHRDQFRSIPLAEFQTLSSVPHLRFFSLQKGSLKQNEQHTAEMLSLIDFGDQLDEQHGPFMDTAAIMQNLDLVITADTAVAHLAGAMGIPVCVLLCDIPEWRWQLKRTDSPWYPTMRLYRQTSLGDWSGVFQELATDLAGLISHLQNERTPIPA
ncbi:MAG: tetratricopeptide repeat protein [Planctomycetaceae bacterium]